jgi:hypothetical protein
LPTPQTQGLHFDFISFKRFYINYLNNIFRLNGVAKIEVNDRIILGKLRSTTVEGLEEMTFDGQINNYFKLNAAVQKSPDLKFTLKADSPDLPKLDMTGHYKDTSDDTYLKINLNNNQRVFVIVNPSMMDVSVKDLYFPVAVSISSGLSDSSRMNLKAEICWNTYDCQSETERIEVVIPVNLQTRLDEMSMVVFWRNKQTSAFHYKQKNSSSEMKYIENDVTVFSVESIVDKVYNSGNYPSLIFGFQSYIKIIMQALNHSGSIASIQSTCQTDF